jgi:hypothetical protein
LDKNTEVSLQRKKAKREKEYVPPVEKSSNLNSKSTTEGINLYNLFLLSTLLSFVSLLDTSKLVKNVKKKLKRLQTD